MAAISMEMIKELRERTQAGIMDCKRALQETDGDMEKAVTYLREKGLAAAAKRAGRTVKEGIVDAYIHMGGRLGVLIEVNCETDFVARNDVFQELVRDLAMQVAAQGPSYIRREDVPESIIENERAVYAAAARNEGKPERIIERIVDGRMERFFKESCLLEQPFIKDTDKTVADLVNEKIAAIGENIFVRRFVRYELGEGIADD